MKKEKVYIVKVYSYYTKTEDILATAFKEKEKAIEYCLNQLNEEDKIKNEKAKARNLITDNEYFSKNYSYNIGELDLV